MPADSKTKIYFLLLLSIVLFICSCKKKQPPITVSNQKSAEAGRQQSRQKTANESSDAVGLDIKLPKPMFEGTPPPNIPVANLEKPRTAGQQRPLFFVPSGTTNVAAGKPIIGFNEETIIGELAMITDGDKEASDGSYVELGPGIKKITIDLGGFFYIYAVCLWHYHKEPRVYYDVIVQTADDLDFTSGLKTLYNNDVDNSAGQGIGKDMHYTETNEGRLIDAKGVRARYVRLYSGGNTRNELNNYIEVEVYGKPAK